MRKANAFLGFATAFMAFSANASDAHGDLVIHVSGFKSAHGHAVAKLFQPGDDVLKRGRWQSVAAIESGQAEPVFTAVKAGVYALVVFHDENDSGDVDHNFLGLPKEPLGFSNGFALGLTSGLPNFEKLSFTHLPQTQRLEVNIK